MPDANSYRRRLGPLLSQYQQAVLACTNERRALQEAELQADAAKQAQALVQEVAEQLQTHVHAQLAGVVARCMQTVFGEDEAYGFRINFVKRRGRTEAELVFVRDDQEIDPLTAAGGGAVDVAAFALRLACLLLLHPPKRRVLLLDEPFRFLSKTYRPRVRQLLVELAQELDLQIIMVTHAMDLVTGKVINLGEDL